MKQKRRQRLILLALAAVILAAAGAGAFVLRKQMKAKRIAGLRESGLAAYAEGDYTAALPKLSGAVGGGVQDPEVLLAFGDCRRQIPQEDGGHLVFASRVLDKVPQGAPERVRALEMLTEIYAQLRLTNEWEVTLDELLDRDESNRLALESSVVLGVLQNDRARIDEALAGLVGHYPDDFRAHLMRVVAAQEIGEDPDTVRRLADDLDEQFGDEIGLWLFKAAIELERGSEQSLQEAADLTRAALEREIDKAEELRSLVDMIDTLADRNAPLEVDPMAEVLEPRMVEGPLVDDARRIALTRAVRRGEADTIEAIVAQIEGDAEGASTPTLGWAHVARALTQRQESQEIRDHLVAAADGQWWLSIGEAIRAAGEQRHADAVRILDGLDPLEGERELLLYARAFQLAQSGDALGAIRLFSDLAPSWRSVRSTIGRLYFDTGRYDQVVNLFLRQVASGAELTIMEARLFMAAFLETASTPEQKAEALRLASEFDQDTDDPAVSLLHVRALLLNGSPENLDQAAAIVSDLLDGETPIGLSPLARRFRDTHPEIADRIEQTIDPLEQRARATVAGAPGADSPSELIAAFEQRITGADPRIQRSLRMRLAEALDAIDAEQAVARLQSLSETYEHDATVQTFVLQRSATWDNKILVSDAIGRLQRASGDISTPWRVFDARRVLTFSPNDAAERSRVLRLLAEAKRAGRLTPSGSVAMSELLRLGGDEARALAELQSAYDEDPLNQVELLPTLIQRLDAAGRTADAERQMARFAERRPESLPPALLAQRAAMRLTRGDLDGARTDYQYLADRGDSSALVGVARAMLAKGDLSGADQIMRDAAEGESPTDEILGVAGEIAHAAGDPARAREYVQEISNQGVRMFQTAVLDERDGEDAAAEQSLREAVEFGHTQARDALAVKLFRSGRFTEIPDVLTTRPTHETLQKLVALCRTAPEEVTRKVQRSVFSVQEAEPALEYARVLLDRDAATYGERLQVVVTAYPGYFPARHELAAWCLAPTAPGAPPRDADRGIQLLRRGADLAPNDTRAAAALTGALLKTNRWNEGLAAASAWRSLSRDDTLAADIAYAIALAKLGRIDEALQQIDVERIKTAPDIEPSYRTVLAGLYLQQGGLEEARVLLYDEAKSDADGAAVFLSALDIESTPPETARRWLTLADELGVTEPTFTSRLAHAWMRLAMRTGEQADFGRSADLFGGLRSDAGALAMFAMTSEQAGRYDDAEPAYREAIARNQDAPALYNNLAYLLATQRGKAADAVRFAQQAVDLSAGQDAAMRVSFLDTLGVAQLENGQPRDAELTFREARRLATTRQTGLELGLCRALLDQGKTDEARRLFNEISRVADLQDLSGDYTRGLLASIRDDLGG
jgi:tetratricopeptide (TPR) repeat protein